VLLAKRRQRVLVMDWDLEAPGLHRYFLSYYKHDRSSNKGIIQLLREAVENAATTWEPCLRRLTVPDCAHLHMLTSGDGSSDYADLVRGFSWTEFFTNHNGGEILERWRNEWKEAFDFILIDSRTGITDAGGVARYYCRMYWFLSLWRTNRVLNGAFKSRWACSTHGAG
jgi:Mrp family chromosome partitioning ATPase